METRGIRNKNPGNIEKNSIVWKGSIEGKDIRFVTFTSFAYGFRAMFKILISYNLRGINTISAIISKWAPSNENDTINYIRVVATHSGISSNEIIDINNVSQMFRIVKAIAYVECGSSIEKLDLTTILNEAWTLI